MAEATGWPEGTEWPGWVPVGVREVVEQHWRPKGGRTAWEADAAKAGAPAFGATVRAERQRVDGRYVHLWGDVGRLVVTGGEGALIGTLILAGRLRTIGYMQSGAG